MIIKISIYRVDLTGTYTTINTLMCSLRQHVARACEQGLIVCVFKTHLFSKLICFQNSIVLKAHLFSKLISFSKNIFDILWSYDYCFLITKISGCRGDVTGTSAKTNTLMCSLRQHVARAYKQGNDFVPRSPMTLKNAARPQMLTTSSRNRLGKSGRQCV